jgi:hypothetical protein
MSSFLPPSLNPQQVSPVPPSVAQQMSYSQQMQMQPPPMFGGNSGGQGGFNTTGITSGVRSLLQNIEQQANPLFGLKNGLMNYLRNVESGGMGNASPGIMGLQSQGPISPYNNSQAMSMGNLGGGGLGLSSLLRGQQIAQSGG